MRAYMKKKGIDLSLHTYGITALTYMAYGLFSSLIIGLIMKTLGEQLHIDFLVSAGQAASNHYGAAIGAAVSYGLKAPPLVLFSAVISGAVGVEVGGGPAGAFAAALIGTEVGKLVSKTTKLDILITPFVSILAGWASAQFIGKLIAEGMLILGDAVNWSVNQQPIIMGILVATLMGLALTAPISSAAIAIMMGLDGIAAGAATVGCSAQMVGFAVSSYRENGISGLLSQGIGTSMLQVPNIIKKPIILIPPTAAGIILAPLATVVFHMENVKEGAGMGTSGLVGQIFTLSTMGFHGEVWLYIAILHIIGPAVISLVISEYFRRKQWIKYGDMKLELET